MKLKLLALAMASAVSGVSIATESVAISPVLEKQGSTAELKRNTLLSDFWTTARGKESFSGIDTSKPMTAVGRPWSGEVTTDRVLAILIDFPDYPVNAVTPDLTRNYYADYSKEHYQNMLFSKSGYVGPNGERMMSMNQYFLDQSGGSYQVEGKVAGWYTAAHNAAVYGSQTEHAKDSDVRSLVLEAITHVANDPSIDLSYFDQEDRYDFDNDGNFREPDGIIDHVMIFHSSIDQAAGGGALGSDAIWSHRSSVGFHDIGATGFKIHDYTVQPVDGAAGVSAHEYGHDLGLPDEYDVGYSEDGLGVIEPSPGSLVGYWSIMSAGSYGGAIPGSAPTGMSPFAKQYLQSTMGGNWFVGTTVHEDSLTPTGAVYKLDAASLRGNNNDYIRVDLEDKQVQKLKTKSGLGFISSAIPDSNLAIYTIDFEVDLSSENSGLLSFATDYDTDARNSLVQVRATNTQGDELVLDGNITDTSSRFSGYIGAGYTGKSDGLVDAEFDLTQFAGQKVKLSIQYWAFNTGRIGVMFDDIRVTNNTHVIAQFDADSQSNNGLQLNGFEASSGIFSYPHYYLVEWRQHAGVDASLSRTARGAEYTPGMLVWYVDTSFRPEDNDGNGSVTQGDNHVGEHPGDGWLGLVDADRNPIFYNTGEMAGSMFQIRDAAFGFDLQQPFDWYSITRGISLSDPFVNSNPRFIDWDDYSNYRRPATGRNIPKKGIIIDVLEQSDDKSVASIKISKVW